MRRYSAYKDSDIEWVGEIPDRWSTKPLFALFKERQAPNEGNAETNVLSLSYGRIIRRDVESNFGLLPESFETYNIVEPLDIVLRLTDLQNDKRSLRCGLVQEKGIITSAYLTLEKKAEIDPKYMFYLLHNYDIWKVFYSMGGGVRQAIKFDDLKRLPILLPSLEEQKAVVSYLDRKTVQIDDLMAKKKRMIEVLTEERTAIINQAVTKGLDPKAEMQDSGIEWLGKVPRHWGVKRLKYLIHGRLEYGANEVAELDDISMPRYIRITDFDDDGTLRADTFKSLSEDKAKEYLLEEGDVLFARSGATVGKTFQFKNYKGRACFAGYLIKACPNQKLLSDFLYYFTRSNAYENWKNSIFNQATIQNIGADKYSILSLPLPSAKEQKEIVNFIIAKCERIDGIIFRAEQAIDLLKEYRTALISEVVTGKIDVRD